MRNVTTELAKRSETRKKSITRSVSPSAIKYNDAQYSTEVSERTQRRPLTPLYQLRPVGILLSTHCRT